MTEPIIGSVAVEVVPSTETFWKQFVAKTSGQASAAGKQAGKDYGDGVSKGGSTSGENFGSEFDRSVKTRLAAALSNLPSAKITADSTAADQRVAQLRKNIETLSKTVGVHISDDAALAAINHVRGELAKLATGSDSIRVKVDTGAASAELDALQVQIAGLGSGGNGSGGSSSGSGGGINLPSFAVAGILSALPLIGPLAGAASSALGQLAGAAGVAGLAVAGFNKDIAAGNTVGLAIEKQVNGLSDSLGKLETTAAKGASGGVIDGLKQLNQFLPQLDPIVGQLAQHLGAAFSVGTGALVTAVKVASPLLSDAGKYAEILAHNLAGAAASPEFAQFIAYGRQELPVIITTIDNLVGASTHLVEALAPLGTVVLAALNGVSAVLKAIPTGVLTTLAQGAALAYISFKGLAIIEAVNKSLKAYAALSLVAAGASKELAASNATAAMGFKSIVAGSSLAAIGLLALPLAAAGVGGYFVNQAENATALGKALQTVAKNTDDYKQALITSRGVVDQNVQSSVALNLQQTGIADKAAKAGISLAQLTQGVSGTSAQFNELVKSYKAQGQPSANTITALATLRAEFLSGQQDAAQYNAALNQLAKSSGATAASFDATATALGISSATATKYAAIVGITSTEVDAGTISQKQLNTAVSGIANAYDHATAAGSDYLAALSTFSGTEGTASDRAALIGATLKAANGDLLGFSGSISDAAVANQSFVTSFDDARTAANKAGTAFDDAKTGVVDLAKGTINYNNAAAGPLIQNLQALQDAAVKAAGATYQHEVATGKGAQAAKDASDQYYAQTHGALEAEYVQLGLTKGQADKLADSYFKLPKDISTTIKAIGTDPVVTVLEKIGKLLATFTGQPWDASVGVTGVDAASNAVDTFKAKLQQLQGTHVETFVGVTQTPTQFAGIPAVKHPAAGGFIQGPGTGTSDSIPAMISNGEFVIKASQTAKHRDLLEQINKGTQGFAAGGFVGVSAPAVDTSAATTAANKAAAAAKKVATAANQQANIKFTVSTDFGKVISAALGSVSAVQSAMTTLINAVHSGIAKGVGTSGLVSQLQSENTKLTALAATRASLATKITAAQAKLTSLESSFTSEKSTVSQAVTSGFDLPTVASGSGFDPFSGAAGTSTAAGIIASLTTNNAAESKFAQQLAKLKKSGLNASLLQQIGEAGVTSGGAAAGALAGASASQIKKLNSLFSQSNAFGAQTGQSVAAGLFGSQIQAQAGTVAKLQAQKASVDATALAYAKALRTELQGFGINITTDTNGLVKVVKAEIAAETKTLTDAAKYH